MRAIRPTKMRELGVNQVGDLDTVPFVADQHKILIGRKRLDALGKAIDEIRRISGRGLMSNRVHNAQHVLGATILNP
jgi:hypothetical protein